MSIGIISKSFTDEFGNTTSVYKANSGDRTTCTYTLFSNIGFERQVNGNFSFDYTNKRISFTDGISSWLKEGFKVGDTVRYTVYDPSDAIATADNGALQDQTVTVTAVTDGQITLSNLLPTIPSNYRFRIFVQSAYHAELDLLVNHKLSGNGFDEFSHIDNQETRYFYNGLNVLATATPVAMNATGNLSGQYEVESVTVEVLTRTTEGMTFKVVFKVIQSAIYDLTIFNSGAFINLSTGYELFRTANDNTTKSRIFDTTLSQTNGYLGATADFETLTIPSLSYNRATESATFVIRHNFLSIDAIGFSYVPQTDSDFKYKPESQSNYGYTSWTFNGDSVGTNNDLGTPATVEIQNYAVVFNGTNYELSFDFVKNQAFIDEFSNNKDSGDRLFRMWVRANGRNYLIFNQELQFYQQPPQAFVPDYYELLSDNTNANDFTGAGDTSFSVEDNVAVLTRILVQNQELLTSFDVNVYVQNTLGDFRFNLKEFTYTVDPNSYDPITERYIINDVIDFGYNLPTDNVKNTFNIYTEDVSPTSYYVVIHYPFLIRWEDWITIQNYGQAVPFWQTTANGIKFPTERWYQYESAANYNVQLEVKKTNTDGIYFAIKDLDFVDYGNGDLTSTIRTFRLDGTELFGNYIAGETIRIRATHQASAPIVSGFAWISAERFENTPRWQVNSAIADNNPLNPLTFESVTIVGDTITVTALFNYDLMPYSDISFSSKGYAEI